MFKGPQTQDCAHQRAIKVNGADTNSSSDEEVRQHGWVQAPLWEFLHYTRRASATVKLFVCYSETPLRSIRRGTRQSRVRKHVTALNDDLSKFLIKGYHTSVLHVSASDFTKYQNFSHLLDVSIVSKNYFNISNLTYIFAC